jgi:hypothetical protein
LILLGDELLLQDYVIKNAFNLGLGPSRDRIVHRFGSIWRFREALGIKNSRSAGKYNSWELADYVDFASKLSSKLGKKPTRNDYIEEIKKMVVRQLGCLIAIWLGVLVH